MQKTYFLAMGLCLTGLIFLGTTVAIEAPTPPPLRDAHEAARDATLEEVLAWWNEGIHLEAGASDSPAHPVEVEVAGDGVIVGTPVDQPTNVPLPGAEDPAAHSKCRYYSEGYYT